MKSTAHPSLRRGILHGHFLQNYPRDQIPLGDTFGESLAHIVDQLPDIRDLSGLRVIVRWDPLVAEIGFRLEDKLYRIEFGDVDSPENPDLPFFTFGYREPFLEKDRRDSSRLRPVRDHSQHQPINAGDGDCTRDSAKEKQMT